jgi:hypothetical protein
MNVDFILDKNGLRLEENFAFEKPSLACFELYIHESLFLLRNCQTARLDCEHGAMSMRKLNLSWGLTNVFENNFFLMLFTALDKSHVNERLKNDLAFSFVDSNRQLSQRAFITEHFNNLGLIFKLFTKILDFGSHGETGGNLRLHVVKDREIGIGALIDSDPFGLVSEISDFDSDFIKLIDLNVLENDF